jgi:polyhydroxyalkanoate synthesis regulator phasin
MTAGPADDRGGMMVDDLRNYLQMAAGLTEATTTKAKDVVASLLSSGMTLSTKAVPPPEMMGQVQQLADGLVTTSKENREALTALVRGEVDKAVGRMGFVREDELAALRRHVERLEKQLADVRSAASASDLPPPAGPPAPAAPAPSAEAGHAKPPAKKKKKIVVAPEDQA